MKIEIRDETAADFQAIESVTIAAFLNAPHTGHNEHAIVRLLRDSGCLSVSLVAVADGMIMGHVAMSPVTISSGVRNWFGLGPISVLPQRQRRGVGSLLMHEALRRLRESDAAGCVLLGDPRYYSRFGFKADVDLILPGVPTEYFQAITFGASRARGIVAYHAAFNAPAGPSEPEVR
jgi:putative acetyltransferase